MFEMNLRRQIIGRKMHIQVSGDYISFGLSSSDKAGLTLDIRNIDKAINCRVKRQFTGEGEKQRYIHMLLSNNDLP